jgi:isopenicillin-N N-acyltransferase like protein
MFRALLILLFPTLVLAQAKVNPYPISKFEGGELRHHQGIPILILSGTPQEMGRQYGKLGLVPAKPLIAKLDQLVEQAGFKPVYPLLMQISAGLGTLFPKHAIEELDAAAKVAEIDRKVLIFGNTIGDLAKHPSCSTMVVEPGRSTTRESLFGRNFDWLDFENLAEHTMVTVRKTPGKFAFASISLPAIVGVISGMNEHGLALTLNEITRSNDGSPKFKVGMPLLLIHREILENCKNIDEAEAFYKKANPTTWAAVTICDPKAGCVLEVTPTQVIRRRTDVGVTCCTNHFRTDPLKSKTECWRYSKLAEYQNSDKKLGLADVAGALHDVNQGRNTMQTMIFEPGSLTLHLSFAGRPSTAQPLVKIELADLFKK